MRKLIIIFMFLLFVPLVLSVEVETKSVFDQGETFFAIISGNFVDSITTKDVAFYRGHVRIPMIYEVKKLNDDFYIYALLLNKNEGNYSLRIENVRYYKVNEVVDDDIIANFSISNKTNPFSVNPGFIILEGEESKTFSVKLKNLLDKKINIFLDLNENFQYENSVNLIELKTSEEKNLGFELIDSESLQDLKIITFTYEESSYDLRVFSVSKSPDSSEVSSATKDFDLEFNPQNLEVSMPTDSQAKRVIHIQNTGKSNIENLVLSISEVLSDYVVLSDYGITDFGPDENKKIEISIISDLEEAIIEGFIFANTENMETNFFLTLNFIEDFIPAIEGSSQEQQSGNTCSEVGGEICSDNFECGGDVFHASDGVCCLGICNEIESDSSGKLLGWLLILALVVLAWGFYKFKYKKVGKR